MTLGDGGTGSPRQLELEKAIYGWPTRTSFMRKGPFHNFDMLDWLYRLTSEDIFKDFVEN